MSMLLAAAAAQTHNHPHALVEDYIADAACKADYIRFSKRVCVGNGKCYPHGTDSINGCKSVKMWKWPDHEVGVNPHHTKRITKNGNDVRKVVWAYASDITQGEAVQAYNAEGQVTVENLMNTPVNQVAFIANVDIEQPDKWFKPGKNNTNGCGQKQTWDLPFGYKGNTSQVEKFQQNLGKLHESGIKITLTMGSWCTQFPITTAEEWDTAKFTSFVNYFRELRANTFGNNLDGIDFDWEGFCKIECLKGECACDWSDNECGNLTPEALAAGHTWQVTDSKGKQHKKMCWMLPTSSTFQVLTGIVHYMKDAGFAATLVPMSVALYTGEEDQSTNKVMRNEYGKYRKHTYEGTEVDVLQKADGVLLQWYSGFDAGLCMHSPDSSACACNNVPDKDYPNVINQTDGLVMSFWSTHPSVGGNMFPQSYPVRCQACGKNVTLPDGTHGPFPCASEDDKWFHPADKRVNGTSALTAEHKTKLENYTKTMKTIPYWWVEGVEVGSKCPRSIDCPDFQYEGEPRYSRQVKLLKSLSKIIALNKVSIGFETLGIDVLAQYEAYADPALPYTTVSPKQIWNATKFYNNCTQNMTLSNYKEEKRCGQPLLSQQWGPKFSAKDIVGLEAAVRTQLGGELAGVGLFTLDGVLAQAPGKKERYWYNEMMLLNQTYKLPCSGTRCGQWKPPTPGPAPGPSPGPGPAPSGSTYNCDWSSGSPVCAVDPKGWATKAQCDSLCHH